MIHRNIYWLGLLSFFNDVTADMIVPLLPAFLSGLGVGAGFLGLMEGLANSLSHITMLFSGWYADRYDNDKKITVFGYRLCSFVRPLMAIPIPWVTLVVRLTDRIGKGIRTPPRDRLITASAEKAVWGRSFGIQRAMDHAGALIGPPIAAWLLSAYAIKLSTLFLIACLPAILSVLLIPRKIRATAVRPAHPVSFISLRRMPRPLRLYVGIILLSAFSTPSELFLILKMQKLGMALYQIPMAWFLLTLFTLVAAYLGGAISDRWSRRRTIGLGWLLFAAVYVAFAFNANLKWSWILMALYGVHAGLIEAAERVYPAMLVGDDQRAMALGWYYFAYGIGLLPASLIFGILWDSFGASFAFLFNAGLTLLAVMLLFFLPSDRKLKEQPL